MRITRKAWELAKALAWAVLLGFLFVTFAAAEAIRQAMTGDDPNGPRR